jgi:hypothetical protein
VSIDNLRYFGVPRLNPAQYGRLVILRRWSMGSACSGSAVIALTATRFAIWPAFILAAVITSIRAVVTMRARRDWLLARVAEHDWRNNKIPVVLTFAFAVAVIRVRPHLWWLPLALVLGIAAKRFAFGRAGAMAAIRLRHSKIATPVYELEHKSGRKITLISTSTVGTVDYFRGSQNF